MFSLPPARTGRCAVAGTLLLTALGTATLPGVSHAAPASVPLRTITVTAARPALPRTIPAGPLAIRLVTDASTPYGIGLVRLKPSASFAEAQKAGGDLFKLRHFVTFIGGEVVPPGRAATVIVNAGVPGYYAMHSSGKEGGPGRVLPFAVTPPAASVAAPVTSSHTVRLLGHSFAGLPRHLRAGLTTFKVTNRALGLRNMQIWRLGPGRTQRDFITAFTSANGRSEPGWLHLAGGMDVLSSGQTAWATVRLAPGTYVAECPLPDGPNGRALVLEGMIATFTVS